MHLYLTCSIQRCISHNRIFFRPRRHEHGTRSERKAHAPNRYLIWHPFKPVPHWERPPNPILGS
jgi:hypothetical protein